MIDKEALRRARQRRALTMWELGKVAKVGYVTVWRLENEESGSVRMSTLRKLADALDVQPGELLVDGDTKDSDLGREA